MTTHSVLSIIYMAQAIEALGIDPAPVLARHGIDLARIDPAGRIERTRAMRINADFAELVPPTAGLRIGNAMSFAGYGPFTMLLMTCDSALDAFRAGVRYQQLTFLHSTLRLELGEIRSALVLTPQRLPEATFRFLADMEMAGTFKLIRDMQATIGHDLRPERVDMPYPAPREAAAYEAHFGSPVRFGEAEGRFWVRNEHLHLRFRTADPTAHGMFRTLCDQQLAQLQRDEGNTRLSDQVRTHLELFSEGFPDAAEVAQALGLGERTLRRRLSEEETSFRDLLAAVRLRKAQHLLRHSSLPVEAIAQQLGYAESSAFIHAFQRWTGLTPAAHRRQGDAPPTGQP